MLITTNPELPGGQALTATSPPGTTSLCADQAPLYPTWLAGLSTATASSTPARRTHAQRGPGLHKAAEVVVRDPEQSPDGTPLTGEQSGGRSMLSGPTAQASHTPHQDSMLIRGAGAQPGSRAQPLPVPGRAAKAGQGGKLSGLSEPWVHAAWLVVAEGCPLMMSLRMVPMWMLSARAHLHADGVQQYWRPSSRGTEGRRYLGRGSYSAKSLPAGLPGSLVMRQGNVKLKTPNM